MNFWKGSSGIQGCMKHNRPQRNTETSQRHSRRESICHAWKRGAWPAAVPRHSCVTKSNLSAVQHALLQYLRLSITPHEYLMLGKGGRQEEELLYRQIYYFMYVPLYVLLPVFQISCLDHITVCNCSTTNHFLLPSRHTRKLQEINARWEEA